MHTLKRLLVLTLCTVLVAPMTGMLAFLTMQEKQEASDSLHQALNRAVGSYRSRTSLVALQNRGASTLDVQREKLRAITKRQRELREAILSMRATLTMIQKRHSIVLQDAASVHDRIEEEKVTFAQLVRDAYVRSLASDQVANDSRRLIVSALQDNVPPQALPARMSRIVRVHADYLGDLSLAEQTFKRLDAMMKERDALLAERQVSAASFESTRESVEVSAEKLEEIKAIMTDVHDQVLKLQGELARIDAKLKAKAERALIEKRLLDPLKPGSNGSSTGKRPAFTWPVYGTVSAGFHNESYKKFFGVAHEGMDIVVGEGTPVRSSADGVVFLVRDGGAKGYTYVLVGHRNGYATLYGHLLAVSVDAGQVVTAGQVIGLSGGRPGTHGAGPMTTAAHLHFEVIQSGVNIDPKSVLP